MKIHDELFIGLVFVTPWSDSNRRERCCRPVPVLSATRLVLQRPWLSRCGDD